MAGADAMGDGHRLVTPAASAPARMQHFSRGHAPEPQRNLGRLSEISRVAMRHGFGYLIEGHRRHPPELEGTARGRHLREMLDELGPTFVKFGQLLSTRPDVVPPDIIQELRGLQDDVRPFPFADVERTIQEELGQPIERLFLEFDETPLAAASIGQVHRAVLPNGRHVAVKVQRPNAPRQIEADLSLMYQAARLVKDRIRALEFIDANDIVDEFARSIRQELDYRLEARNADAFHRNFAGHPHVAIPRVYWTYTRSRVLTLEELEGVQLGDLELEHWSLEQRRNLAYLVTEAWMQMIFRDGFFHGDPHPANILVLAPDRVGLVDFGLTGRLTDDDMSKLTRLFIDAASENVEMLPKRLAALGVQYPKEREEEFVLALREMYERYYGASAPGDRPAPGHPRGVRPDLLAEPPAPDAVRDARQGDRDARLGRRRALSGLQRLRGREAVRARPDARAVHAAADRAPRAARGPALAQIALDLPHQIHDTLEQVRDGQIEVGFVNRGLDDFIAKLDPMFNRLVVALIVLGGLIGSGLVGSARRRRPSGARPEHRLVHRVRRLGRARRSGCSGASSAPGGSERGLRGRSAILISAISPARRPSELVGREDLLELLVDGDDAGPNRGRGRPAALGDGDRHAAAVVGSGSRSR